MEELLHKNIFNEEDLHKLSPDYTPKIQTRMEMRRVKDTHGHGNGTGYDCIIRSGTWQRKSIKKTKDNFKINKEITKIRNNFHNLDLKNRIMLKYVNSLKPKTFTSKEKILVNGSKTEVEDEQDFYLQEITKDLSNLVINGDGDFKVNTKTISNRRNTRTQNCKIPDIESTLEMKLEQDDDTMTADILRIECTYTKETSIIEKYDNTEEYNTELGEKNDLEIYPNENIHLGSDLQPFLVMMGLTPKSSRSDGDYSDRHEQYDKSTKHMLIENDDINDIPQCYSTRGKIDMTNFLCVAPMRIKISEREEKILKKYVEKWKIYVTFKKQVVSQQRQATLDNFFDKLAKKKAHLNECNESAKKAQLLAYDYNTYQRRYKLQKHIIALQRAKLEEQNRVIEELKYNKILEASRKSVEAMKDEVRKSYYDVDRQLKPKIKVLSNELKLHNIEDPSLALHCLKVPQFIQRMEKRARQREEKHAIIRERRRQMEEERIRLKQQAELAKAEMDKEEKMNRIKELKEKRRREKIETIRKKQYAARLRALIVMADLHYEKSLMTKYGIRPFRILIDMKRDNYEKAKAHYVFQLKNNVFLNWMWYTEDMWYERNFIADDFHRKKLLRIGMKSFRQNCFSYVLKKQVADDYYDLYVTQLIFRKFREGIEILKKEHEVKWKRAIAYHNSNVLFKTFTCWRTLPALNELKRQQDARKARWREKVLQVVPDYIPPED